MKEIVQSSQFKQDLKKIKRSGRHEIDKLLTVIELLASDKILDEKYKCHDLIGNCKNYKECHITPDWLLIYKITNERVILVRTGSHSNLF